MMHGEGRTSSSLSSSCSFLPTPPPTTSSPYRSGAACTSTKRAAHAGEEEPGRAGRAGLGRGGAAGVGWRGEDAGQARWVLTVNNVNFYYNFRPEGEHENTLV